MVVYIKCKGCGSDFNSQIQIGDSKESFLRAASGSNLSNNTLQCTNCGPSFPYSGNDYFWKD